MRSKFMAALMSGALVVSLGLTACGGGAASSSSAKEEKTETTAVDTADAEEETEVTTDSVTESAADAEGELFAACDAIGFANWTDFWEGVTSDEEVVLWGENAKGDEGIFVILSEDGKQYMGFVGDVTNPSADTVQIVDRTSGNGVEYKVEGTNEAGNGVISYNGSAVELEKVSAEDFVAAVMAISSSATSAL